MKLSAVLLARYYGLVQIEDLNSNGTVYYPEVVAALVERYGFMKFPQKIEEFDESKGIEFTGGRIGKYVIEKLMIFNSGIYIDTLADTATSETIWYDLMEWAVGKFELTFRRDMVTRAAYVSHVTFHSDAPILAVHPLLSKIARRVSDEVAENFKQNLEYEPATVGLSFDTLSTKFGVAGFSVQKREGVAFWENKYFSAAPLKTSVHLELLEEWEKTFGG
ncbi:MAG TPA: hypothetical protein VND90_03460 [Terracidiphilus sp.]|nr:hypothetical protein [Terracidiphilus sp.]